MGDQTNQREAQGPIFLRMWLKRKSMWRLFWTPPHCLAASGERQRWHWGCDGFHGVGAAERHHDQVGSNLHWVEGNQHQHHWHAWYTPCCTSHSSVARQDFSRPALVDCGFALVCRSRGLHGGSGESTASVGQRNPGAVLGWWSSGPDVHCGQTNEKIQHPLFGFHQ